jgi:hypothetical protein
VLLGVPLASSMKMQMVTKRKKGDQSFHHKSNSSDSQYLGQYHYLSYSNLMLNFCPLPTNNKNIKQYTINEHLNATHEPITMVDMVNQSIAINA